MKKYISILAAVIMLMGLTACGTGSQSQSEPSSEATTEKEAMTGIANPWSKAKSPEEAAKGAGVESFVVPKELTETPNGEIRWEGFQYMKGIAEADGCIGTADLIVRKGLKAENGEDISGDYTEYKYQWNQEVGDQKVTCFGNEEGKMMRTIWTNGDYSYSIMVRGQGDHYDVYGVDAEAVEIMVSGIS